MNIHIWRITYTAYAQGYPDQHYEKLVATKSLDLVEISRALSNSQSTACIDRAEYLGEGMYLATDLDGRLQEMDIGLDLYTQRHERRDT